MLLLHLRYSVSLNCSRPEFKQYHVLFRVTECKNWRDMSLRHCNAYHTKEGPWKAVREKNKELKMKKESLLELKRKLRDERREKRKKNEEPAASKPKPKMDLSVGTLYSTEIIRLRLF